MLVYCAPEEEDILTAEMWDAGTLGVVEEPGGFRAFFDNETRIEDLSSRLGRDPASVRVEDDVDWAQLSRDSFKPVLVGTRFFLAPPWCEIPAPHGRIRLEVNPGMACGTGYHPCTQLCLEALERYLKPGDSVLDVGTGSGILSQAARLLGAGRIIACDVDEQAAMIARQRIGSDVYAGSADAIRACSFDIIVANISASAVEDLQPEFARIRKGKSILIESGFSETEQVEGMEATAAFKKDGWVCLINNSNM